MSLDCYGLIGQPRYLPPGILAPYAGAETNIPSGWLLCSGQTVDKTTYWELFAVIGTTFGGSGSGFAVPDLRGRFPLGADNMGGTSADRVTAAAADTIGSGAGVETTSYTPAGTNSAPDTGGTAISTSQMPAHTHTYSDPNLAAGSVAASAGGGVTNSTGSTGGGGSHSHSTTAPTFTGTAATPNVMNPYLTINYLIKT